MVGPCVSRWHSNPSYPPLFLESLSIYSLSERSEERIYTRPLNVKLQIQSQWTTSFLGPSVRRCSTSTTSILGSDSMTSIGALDLSHGTSRAWHPWCQVSHTLTLTQRSLQSTNSFHGLTTPKTPKHEIQARLQDYATTRSYDHIHGH